MRSHGILKLTLIYLLLISNTHGVFQPIEIDVYIGANPGSNKAVPLSQMKGGDKVIKIILFLQ